MTEEQIKQGEQLALAALTSELLVLDVSQIQRNQQKEYTGRSQYPKFKHKPIVKNNNVPQNNDILQDMNFWGSVKQISHHTAQVTKNANKETAAYLVCQLANVFDTVDGHIGHFENGTAEEAASEATSTIP